MDKIDVSVVIPCLNEEETLASCIAKAKTSFKEGQLNGEVIIADNGSTDKSMEIATSLGARIVHIKNKGYGNALRGGFDAAQGEFIVMGDADDSYDFLEVPRFIQELRKGYDMVMGSRLRGRIMPGAMPFLNRFLGNPFLSWFLNFLFNTGISDAHCGLRSFRRDKLKLMKLQSPGMELASEMVIKAALSNLNLAEIPITLHKDGRNRKPHLRPFRDGWRHLRFLLIYSPTNLFFLPGVTVALMGLIPLMSIASGPLWIGNAMLNIHSALIFSSMTLMGFQIINLGIFTKFITPFVDMREYDRLMNFLDKHFTLERGIVLGLTMFLPGFFILCYILYFWISSGYKNIEKENLVVLATTIQVMGIQTIFSSFFMAILLEDKKGKII